MAKLFLLSTSWIRSLKLSRDNFICWYMAVPKKKTSKSKNGMRQAGKGLVAKNNIRIDKDGKVQMSYVERQVRIKKVKQEEVEK